MSPWLALVTRAVRNFRRDNALDLAAGVSFYSLLSLGPLLYLAGTLLSHVLEDSRLIDRLSNFMAPEAAAALDKVTQDLRSGEGLVLLAVPALLWVGTTALSALEHAVNVAFGLSRRRSLWRARLKAVLLLAVGGLVLVADSVVGSVLPYLDRVREALDLPVSRGGLAWFSSHVLLFLLRLATFMAFYKVLPRGKVGWRAAAGGAFCAAFMWEAVRVLFGRLLAGSPALGLLTGALAGTVTLLLWVYASVVVTLLAAEVTAVLDGRRPEESGEAAAGNFA